MARKKECIHKERSGDCYGVGLSGGRDASVAKTIAEMSADSFGQITADAALSTKVPACDAGCQETGTAAGVTGPTKVLVSVEVAPSLWLVVVKRHWFARRECGPI